MLITDIKIQAKNDNRVNVYVDGTYRFSLDIYQLAQQGLKKGIELTEEELAELEQESLFGKVYSRALEYTFMRPHSKKEIKDYLWRKTQPSLDKLGNKKPGIPQEIADRVLHRLEEKNYIDDSKFAKYWIENRNQTKGMSRRKLTSELRSKGVDVSIIESIYEKSERSDASEIQKVIAKKAKKYDDPQKFMRYLASQGFSYDQINSALNNVED